MSQDEPISVRLQIDPEPSPAELVAILHALKHVATNESQPKSPARSRWAEVARRDQLRLPLDEPQNGWSR